MDIDKQGQLELLEEITTAVADGHPELAHIREDTLWRRTLEAIMNGAPNADKLAARALRSLHNEFPHWYE